MSSDEIREVLTADPFVSFRLKLTSGDAYDIHDPQSVALLRTRLFVTFGGGDRWVFVPYEHVAALESTRNGERVRRQKRRKPE